MTSNYIMFGVIAAAILGAGLILQTADAAPDIKNLIDGLVGQIKSMDDRISALNATNNVYDDTIESQLLGISQSQINSENALLSEITILEARLNALESEQVIVEYSINSTGFINAKVSNVWDNIDTGVYSSITRNAVDEIRFGDFDGTFYYGSVDISEFPAGCYYLLTEADDQDHDKKDFCYTP